MTGILFDVRKYSIHDGPGIRTAFFFKGCPLHCAWCHNPEGIAFSPEILLRPDRCLGLDRCGICIKNCPTGAAQPAQSPIAFSPQAVCSICGICVAECPSEARQIVGRKISVNDIVAAALQDESFYDESGGGVTFTGGEPFAQPEFLLECLDACKKNGIHTALDTSGYAPSSIVDRAADSANLFLFDIKHMDSKEHERWTGVPNSQILENLSSLCARGASIWVRIPLIPGVNDSKDNLEATANILEGLNFAKDLNQGCSRAVQILPYHDSAKNKYALRGLPYPMAGFPTPSADTATMAMDTFSSRGITARVGG